MADHDPDLDVSRLGLPASGAAPTFTPAQASVDAALHKARHRQLQRASVVVLALVLPLAVIVGRPQGNSNDSLRVAETPLPSAGSPAPTAQAVPTLGPSAPPALGPNLTPPRTSAGPTSPTVSVVVPRPLATPDVQGQPPTAPRPAPVQQRPAYAGQIGPGYSQFQGTDCVVVNRSTSDGVIRNGYCIYFVTSPSDGRPTWEPNVRICRLYDSTTPGRLTFAAGEEADFALYRGRQGPDGAIVDELLFRFSDTVRYTQGAHGRDVSQGDCWTWQLKLDFDFNSYPEGTGFVGEWRTYAEQIPVPDRVTRRYFTNSSD